MCSLMSMVLSVSWKSSVMSERKYFYIKRLDAGEYDTNIKESDFIGVNSLGTLASKCKDIVKFVQVYHVKGYYSDVISYWHVTRKGKFKGWRECATYGQSLCLTTNIPHVEGRKRVFFIDRYASLEGVIDRYASLEGVRVNDFFKSDDFIGVDKHCHTCSKLSKIDKFVGVDSVVMFKEDSSIILLREVIARSKRE